jgi:hypothetical protein
MFVDSDKMDQIIVKQARNKKNPCDVFLISLHFAEDLATVKSDFGEQFDQQLKQLITEFADITEEPQGLPPHRGHLDHKVTLTGYPPRQRRNRLSVPEYEELKRQCTELLKEGKVRISKSPYAAPIVMVRKSDGSIRVCIDYRAINERTVKDSFPLPRIDDLIDQLREANCITHLDLRSAYNQVRMSDDGPTDDSIAATAFQGLTPNGAPCLLEMLVMGFGLCNAPATFTRLMTHVLDPFINLFVIVYLDDICIYSKSAEEHLDHLRKVLTALRENKLFIKMVKCFWAKRETEYLGFIVGSGNIRTSQSKVAAVKDWPLPETQKQVKSFVAFFSFYRKFIHHFADCSAPLTDLCRKSLPGRVVHSDTTRAAFETLKARMILKAPDSQIWPGSGIYCCDGCE